MCAVAFSQQLVPLAGCAHEQTNPGTRPFAFGIAASPTAAAESPSWQTRAHQQAQAGDAAVGRFFSCWLNAFLGTPRGAP